MVFNRHHVQAFYRVGQPDIELVDYELTPSSPVQVHVEFQCRIKYQWKVRSDDGTRERLIREAEDPLLLTAIRVHPYLFQCYNASHQVVSDVLSSLCSIPPSQRDMITNAVISEGREIGNRISNRGLIKILPLSVEIVIFSVYTCTESAWLVRESLVEGDQWTGNDGMVPASSSSIKALESVTMEEGEDGDGDGGGENCTICLDELPVGAQVTRLLCSHLFHGGCIVRWLEKSHYCPICRFEMPT